MSPRTLATLVLGISLPLANAAAAAEPAPLKSTATRRAGWRTTPDGRTLVGAMQSPLLQDGGEGRRDPDRHNGHRNRENARARISARRRDEDDGQRHSCGQRSRFLVDERDIKGPRGCPRVESRLQEAVHRRYRIRPRCGRDNWPGQPGVFSLGKAALPRRGGRVDSGAGQPRPDADSGQTGRNGIRARRHGRRPGDASAGDQTHALPRFDAGC